MGAIGVLAFGDSITNGGGELQWGVALQSWALWVARAIGVPFTSYAADGARAADITRAQIPAWHARNFLADARYHVGCLYVGANDVRGVDWDPTSFGEAYGQALAWLSARCQRTLALTAPLDLGRPRNPARLRELNEMITRHAAAAGALRVDLSDFGARNLVMFDHIHPTAFGQIAIAQRALAVLAADGLPAKVDPAALIHYETTRFGRLRGDATYAYRHAKLSLRAWRAARTLR